jgi:hypothetical protein
LRAANLGNISSHWLQKVFEVNASLWLGVFNLIIPLFKQVPERYREDYQKPVSANVMLKGLVEAYHRWLDEKHRKRAARRAVRDAASSALSRGMVHEIDDAGVRRQAKRLYQ